MSGKSTKDVTTYCREPAHYQELFRFVSAGPGVGTAFSGVGLPLAASLGGLGLICGVLSVITGEAGKNVSRKVTKHEKLFLFASQKINSLKDRISKALADDRISNEEFENILAEMSKYHEMKKDIRVGFKKNKVKKTAENDEVGQLRREIRAEILKKTSLRRRPSKIEASCFCFLRRYDSDEVCDSDEISLRPPPYNPDFLTLELRSESKILKAFVQMT